MAKDLSEMVLCYFEHLAGRCFQSVFLEALLGAKCFKIWPLALQMQHVLFKLAERLWKASSRRGTQSSHLPFVLIAGENRKLVGDIGVRVDRGGNQTLKVWVSSRQGCAVDASLDWWSKALGTDLIYNLWQVLSPIFVLSPTFCLHVSKFVEMQVTTSSYGFLCCLPGWGSSFTWGFLMQL